MIVAHRCGDFRLNVGQGQLRPTIVPGKFARLSFTLASTWVCPLIKSRCERRRIEAVEMNVSQPAPRSIKPLVDETICTLFGYSKLEGRLLLRKGMKRNEKE